MPVEPSQLTLVATPRTAPATPGQIKRAKSIPRLQKDLEQLDFVVDGRHVSELLTESQPDGLGLIGSFDQNFLAIGDTAWPRFAASGLRQLALQEARDDATWPLEPGRLPLYVCCMCADLACGAITVQVIENEDQVEWTQFRLENGYMDSADLAELSAVGPFYFDAGRYRLRLLDAAERMRVLDHADTAFLPEDESS